MNMSNGRWVRRGSTIVIELPGKSPEADLSLELETSQPTVRRGSSGSAVKTLQARLQTLGFDPGPIDGIFGSGTDSAVRAFQRARGLDADGIVGPQTWAAL
jgi:peptidoglycan hydrolase-like protein with peptidoglycan-binding domain